MELNLLLLLGVVGAAMLLSIVAAWLFASRSQRVSSDAHKNSTQQVIARLDELDRLIERDAKTFRDEFARNRQEAATAAQAQREELSAALKSVSDSTLQSLREISKLLTTQLEQVVGQSARIADKVNERLKELQQDNAQQIEKMRETVDEKLQGTLEKRLGESFKLVSDRLEQVHQGLGAMQQLASDVGGLQKVLSNVKTRGGWGEVQLGALLDQVLTPEQFARNVRPREDSGEIVEFAIKLPGDGDSSAVWLPIDAKFPVEDYHRLVAAQEGNDTAAIEQAAKNLETQIRKCAKDICAKYINPPRTTDFALMFLPTEGLYAEALRRVGLVEQVQRDCRVVITGPTTLAALLNSLQMGFRTLSIQQRSSEVWNLLSAVKTEFGKFGDSLSKVKDKLDQASSDMEKVAVRSRVLTKKLKAVEESSANPQPLLPELLPPEIASLSDEE